MYKLIVTYNSPKLEKEVVEEFTFKTKDEFNEGYKDIVIQNYKLGVEYVKYDFEFTLKV
ncbi:hypothetical protein [Bacillus gaemokensis]|uniref:hypothetical protein n=1 Tax=Bacillus gaemokensis TaxID=574375 RepID=UPI000AE71306|nr:hypothetical protein [Bacillus gaemokensis]